MLAVRCFRKANGTAPEHHLTYDETHSVSNKESSGRILDVSVRSSSGQVWKI
jgi:hypothetical protein